MQFWLQPRIFLPTGILILFAHLLDQPGHPSYAHDATYQCHVIAMDLFLDWQPNVIPMCVSLRLHQMETFSALSSLCAGIPLTKGKQRGPLMSLSC